MKLWITLTVAAALALPLASCKKESSEGSGAAPPSVVSAGHGDRSLIEDQAAISRRMQAAVNPITPPTTGPATGPAGESEGVTAVKAILTKLGELAKNNDIEATWPLLFSSDDCVAMKPVSDMTKPMMTKFEALQQAFKAKKMTVPEELKPILGIAEVTKKFGDEIPALLPNARFQESPGRVDVFFPSGGRIPFVKTASGWKAEMNPKYRAAVPALRDLVAAVGTFVDVLSAGINGGSITDKNLVEQFATLSDKHMKSAMEQFEKAVGPGGPPPLFATEGPAEGTGPATGPSGPGSSTSPSSSGEVPTGTSTTEPSKDNTQPPATDGALKDVSKAFGRPSSK